MSSDIISKDRLIFSFTLTYVLLTHKIAEIAILNI